MKTNFTLPINPRYGVPAISWSDVIAIESNAERWLAGGAKIDNDATRFGTFVHAQIKHGKIKGVPSCEYKEKVLTATVKYGRKSFLAVGTPDSYDENYLNEYKSAKVLWSRKKAEEHGQIFAYAWLIWKNHGWYPKTARLVSLETAEDYDAGVYLTGNMRTIEFPIRFAELLKIQARFAKAFEKISTLAGRCENEKIIKNK